MKEDMFDLENIEKLMLSKSYNKLSKQEKELIHQYINSESEYHDMRETLLNVKKTFQDEKISLRPKPELKESLLKKFEETQNNQSKASTDSKKIVFQSYYKYVGIAASIVLGLFFIFKFYNQEKNIINQPEIAMNNTKDKTVVSPTNTGPIEESTTANTTSISNDNNNINQIRSETSEIDKISEVEEQEDRIESKTIINEELNKPLKDNLGNDDIMVSDNEAFYTSPGETINMYYDYTQTSGVNKKQSDEDLFRNKNDNTSLKQPTKSTKSKIMTNGVVLERVRNEETKNQDLNIKKEISKKEIRKSLIFSDL